MCWRHHEIVEGAQDQRTCLSGVNIVMRKAEIGKRERLDRAACQVLFSEGRKVLENHLESRPLTPCRNASRKL